MTIDTKVCTAGTSIRAISSNMFQFIAYLSQVGKTIIFIGSEGTSQGLRARVPDGGVAAKGAEWLRTPSACHSDRVGPNTPGTCDPGVAHGSRGQIT